jgi:hypothetical protein
MMTSHAVRSTSSRFLLLALVGMALAAGPAVGADDLAMPRPGEVPDSPHPWRVWEAQSKTAALERAAKTPGPGSEPAQDRYDVHHYDLVLDLDPQNSLLTGSVTTTATVVGDGPLQEVVLDLAAEMAVSAVAVGGEPASFVREADLLRVTLSREFLPGEDVAVTVDYQGNPEDAGSAFGFDLVGGSPLIWTLSEPYGARTWWPCKDLNSDKADSVDLHVTVPDDLKVASNGVLVAEVPAPGGRRTFSWASRYPIATYLVSITCHPYEVFTDWYVSANGDSLPIVNHVVPAYEQDARSGYAPTAAMIEAFAGAFGEYPFMEEKYGHAHFPWGGGMEHQTCSSMIYWYHGAGLVAHELAHQWWGDMVTCKDFHHIWLNEGFATWSEAYWREQSEGPAGYRDEMQNAEYFGSGTIYVEDPSDFGSIFDTNLSYNKASWVVHMLRGVLGDEDFFAGLALYRERHAYGAAETADLQAALEDVSGRDLQAFFQQWIHGEYFPRYRYSYTMTPEGEDTRLILRVEQTQTNAGVFVMPVRARVWTDTGFAWVTMENDRRVQYESYLIPGLAYSLDLDPDEWILREVVYDGATAAPAALREVSLTAYPNPFNPTTTLRLEVPEAGTARVAIHDAAGRLVRTLLAGELPAGVREVTWDGQDRCGRPVAAGVYFAVAESAAGRTTTRLALVK